MPKDGGIMAFVTSAGTLDKRDESTRQMLADKADFIGAIRLPGGKNGAFHDNAGTDVTTDIIFLKKHEGKSLAEMSDIPDWVHLGETADGLPINKYFEQHPDMVLGTVVEGNKLYGSGTMVVAEDGFDLKSALHEAVGKLSAEISHERGRDVYAKTADGVQVQIPSNLRNYSFFMSDDQVFFKKNNAACEFRFDKGTAQHKRFKAFIKAKESALLDFAEDYEPVKKFFNGDQKQIFDDVLRILGIYERSKTYIVDKEIEDTAAEIRKIINNPTPYNDIYKLPPLRDTFIAANVKLLSQMAEPVKAAIADARQRVFEELDGKLCHDKLCDKFVRLFQELKEKAESCNDVAALKAITSEADALKLRCLNEIIDTEARMTPPAPPQPPVTGGDGDTPPVVPPPAKPVKKRKSVSIKTINNATTWQIETEDDVKKYVSELEKRLIDTLEDNTVINIEF